MSAKKDRPSPRQRPPRPRPRALRAPAKRATQPQFVRRFSLRALGRQLLPLGPPGPASRWPPRHYRSWYRPVGRARRARFWSQALTNPRVRPSWFELALYLLDCSPLRGLLPQPTSARGERPFDPLSLLLICLWKIAAAQPWDRVARVLADPVQGAGWRQLFGFALHNTPSESTLRAFRDRLPDDLLNQVQRCFLQTLHQAGLLPPVEPHGYLLTGDGQLHDARTCHRCHHAVASCYQPRAPDQPRPCPAQEATQARYGCACDTSACQDRCALAPRLDPEAGFVTYSATKRNERGEKVTQIKRAVFGYRSAATRLVDPLLHHAWTVRTDLYAAPTDEGRTFPSYFAAAYQALPEQRVAYALYDAACGEKQCLDAVYDLGGVPLFDVQADPTDHDPQVCQARGYDAHGHPLCPHGFKLTWQGLERRAQTRARWVCGHLCGQSSQGTVVECPWLAKKRGFHFYLTRHFRDGSYRLARLVPYDTPLWRKYTGWRNVSEGRNSVLARLGLKRLPDYGRPHAAFLITGADVVENWGTLARLVYEATSQDAGFVLRQEAAPFPPPLSELPSGNVVALPSTEEERTRI